MAKHSEHKKELPGIVEATADFERWLAKRIPLVRQDIVAKHAHMAEAPFPFFRATFYRGLQHWPEVCGELAKTPAVPAVRDPHTATILRCRGAGVCPVLGGKRPRTAGAAPLG